MTTIPRITPWFRTISLARPVHFAFTSFRWSARYGLLAALATMLSLLGLPAFGQALEWVNHPVVPAVYGGNDEGRAIARDASGNLYLTGSFIGTADFDPGAGTANLSSAGGRDIFIAKYDASGNYAWAFPIGGASPDDGYGVAVDGSGNVYVTGAFMGSNVDFDPGAGVANLSSAGSIDMFLAKYDASGNYVWANRVGGANTDAGFSLAVDGSGNVYVTGAFWGSNVDFDPGAGVANLSSAGSDEIFMAKYDASGNYVWANRIGGTSVDIGYAIALDGSANVYLSGSFSGSNVDFDPGAGTASLSSSGSSDIFMAKYDASGNYVWAKRAGSSGADVGNSIAVDNSGNVYTTGSFSGSNVDFDPGVGTANLSSAGGTDIFIAQYDASGSYLWARQVGGSGADIGYSIAVDNNGNVYTTGSFSGSNVDFDPGAGTANLSSAGSTDIFIAQLNASGNYGWAKSVGGTVADIGYGLAIDGSGNVLATGYFQGVGIDFDPGAGTANLNSGYTNRDAFALRLSSAGVYHWAINWGANGAQPSGMFCMAISRDASGNVYTTGYFQGGNVDFDPGGGTANLTSAGSNDIFIAKYDASGNYVWARQIGGIGPDYGYGIALDGSGNVYVTGSFSGTVDFDPGAGAANLTSAGGTLDIFIAKYDASGNYVWASRVGSAASEDVGYGIAVDGNGNVHVTGSFIGTVDFDPGAGTANLTSAGSRDMFIAKYDVSGNYVWARQVGGTSDDYGYGIALDGSGNVHVTGRFFGAVDFDPGAGTANLTSVGGYDIFIAKYAASGNYVWARQVGSTSNDMGYGIAVDGSGNVHVTGGFFGTADFDPGAGTANLTSAGSNDIFIAKYDASGNYVWARQVGGTNDDYGFGIALDGSGDVLVTGVFLLTADFDPGAGTANLTSAGSNDIFIAKYDASGNYVAAIQAGSTGADYGYCIAAGGAGKVNVGGNFNGTVDFDPGAGTANRTAVAPSGDIFIAQYGYLVSQTFSGVIRWEHDNSGVKDATVNLSDAFTGSDLTDINGDFSITTDVITGNFTLKPVKNSNKLNGVTVGDATAIQQHLTQINPITDPYKLVCADVNKSNSVSTYDAALINQCLLGNPAANNIFNTSWRFVPASHNMTNPPWGFPEQRTYVGISGPQAGQDFIGMKLGDVTGDADPAMFGAGAPGLVLRTQDAPLKAGETLTAVVTADQADDLAAFQLALYFDPAKLRLAGVQPLAGLPLTADNFGLYRSDEGEVRVVWSQATGVLPGEAAGVFALQFEVLQSGGKLSDALQLQDEILPGRAYNSGLVASGVELIFTELTEVVDPAGANGVLLLQNLPNPFSTETTIKFVLPGACEAQLRIFDATGRELWRVDRACPVGLNAEKVRLDRLTASGVLYYELTTPFGVLTQRMVRVAR